MKEDLAEKIAEMFKEEPFDGKSLNSKKEGLYKDFLEQFNAALSGINGEIEKICEKISAVYEEHKIDIDKVKFGKAQKIVNMTFKYLMLFDDAKEYKEVFRHCDMPIDGLILEYFKEKDPEIKFKNSWSNLEEEDYKKLQKEIKKYCENQEGWTKYPLYDEFTIWFEMQERNR